VSTNATKVRSWSDIRQTAQAAANVGDFVQNADGRAAAFYGSAISVGDRSTLDGAGQYTLPKTAGVVLLDGGRAYWDRSAGAITFRKVNDRDFYAGRIVGDAASADTTCVVSINIDPRYDLDLAEDPYRSVLVGTQAIGGFSGPSRRGLAVKLLVSATNEAQKIDALGKDGFDVAANAIIEMGIEVVSLGSGSNPDFNVGIASATNATDADAIAQHLFVHVDGNSNKIYVQSKDGTHTTAATDTGVTLTAGTRFEVWFDTRVPGAVTVYIDGVQVLASTAFNISSAAGPLMLLAHLEKTASADTFEVDVDWLHARFAEQ
jgi:predicted RecA/RadA family phage recombinase